MSALKKPIAALVGLAAVLLAGLFFATSAGAYPSGVSPTLTVSDTTPACGETITFSGSHYQPGESVTVSDNVGDTVTVVADGNGDISGSLKITCPNGVSPTTITARGNTSGGVDAITINAGGGGNGTGSNGSGSGGLSNTGVAVIGIGALGVVLLVGGGLLLLAGRRRSTVG